MADGWEPSLLEPYRKEIDSIDVELVKLLISRAAAAEAIGKIKKEHKQPIRMPEREEAVLEKLTSMAQPPLSPKAIQAIFRTIMNEISFMQSEL